MERDLPVIFFLGLLLTGCAISTAGNEQPKPKSVKITLYGYPSDWTHDLPLKKPSETAIRDLTRGKVLYSNKLDLSRGIPISSFAPQRRSHAKMIALFREHSITHVSGDHDLDYLPYPFYHEVGWIDWFLVRRDENKGVVRITCERNRGIFGSRKSLVDQAKNGDELIGAWGF